MSIKKEYIIYMNEIGGIENGTYLRSNFRNCCSNITSENNKEVSKS